MARRSVKPKKQPKAPFEPARLLLIEKDVNQLITQTHPDLERAKVIVINRAGKAGRRRCDGIVKLRTATSAERAIAKEDIGDVAYVVEVREEPYEKLGAEARKRRLDHALTHAAGADGKGRWVKVDQHDVEEFGEILDRHGAPDDNPSFAALAKQMSLFAKGGK